MKQFTLDVRLFMTDFMILPFFLSRYQACQVVMLWRSLMVGIDSFIENHIAVNVILLWLMAPD